MKKFTAKDIHTMPQGFYWFAYPGQKPDIMTLYRDTERTRLNFPYPDQTGVWLENDPEAREDLAGIVFYGPIEEPKTEEG